MSGQILHADHPPHCEEKKLHFIVSSNNGLSIVRRLMATCAEEGVPFSVFFTGAGVSAVRDVAIEKVLSFAGVAVVCRESWEDHLSGIPCPIEMGSQTSNSALLASADQTLGF